MNMERGFPFSQDGNFRVSATPEKPVVQTTNYAQPEMHQNQTGQERCHDLLGMYTGRLQESGSGPLTMPSHNIHGAVSRNLHQQGAILPNVHQNGAIPPHLLHNGFTYPNPHRNRTFYPSSSQSGMISPSFRENGTSFSNFRNRNMQHADLNAGGIGSEVQNSAMAPQKVNSFAELLGTMTSLPVTNAPQKVNSFAELLGTMTSLPATDGQSSVGDYNLPQTTNIRPSIPPRSEEQANGCNEFTQTTLGTSFSTISKGNNNVDGVNGLKTTPSHKTPKRKKHRPKVVKEEKPKKTPAKPDATNDTPDGKPKEKRKYVRRKGVETTKNPCTDTAKEVEVCNAEPAADTCRRSLNFDTENRSENRSQSRDCGYQPREKRKYVRRQGVETTKTPCTDIAKEGEVCEDEPAAKSRRRSLNFDAENIVENRSQNRDFGCQGLNNERVKVPFDLNLVSNNPECSTETSIRSTLAPKEPQKILEQQTDSPYKGVRFVEQAPHNSVPFTAQQAAPNNHALNAIARSLSFRNANLNPSDGNSRYNPVHNCRTSLGQTDFANSSGGRQTILHSKLPHVESSMNITGSRGDDSSTEPSQAQSVTLMGSHVFSSENAKAGMYMGRNGTMRQNCSENIKKMGIEDKKIGNSTGLISEITNAGDYFGQSIKRRDHNVQAEANVPGSRGLILSETRGGSTLCNSSSSEANKAAYDWNFSSADLRYKLHQQNTSSDVHQPDERFVWNKSNHSVSIQSSIPIAAVPSCNQAGYTQRNEVLQSPVSVPAKNLIERKSPNTFLSVEHMHQKETSSSRGFGNSSKKVEESRGKKQKVSTAVEDAELLTVDNIKVLTGDDITDWPENLSINNTGKKIAGKEENALVPYAGDRAIVPIKKRVPRPKVDLDPESNRVWNLLMGKEGNESAEEVDPGKQEWWEKERKLLVGRAETFIRRMHQVQGNRRLSKWKGSVVDSVVGVFLTQNVSDHLSSSAFMTLTAKFPLKSRADKPECSRNGEQNQVRVTFPDETTDDYKSLLVNGHSEKEEDILSPQSSSEDIRSSSGSNPETEEQLMGRNFSLNHFPDTVSEQAQRAVACPQGQFPATTSSYLEISHPFTSNCPSPVIPPGGSWLSMLMDPDISLDECMSFFGSVDIGSETANPKPDETGQTHFSEGQSSKVHNATETERKRKAGKEKEEEPFKWDILRQEVESKNGPRGINVNAMDSLDYEALRKADVDIISETIKERGMHKMLAKRIKKFLNRLVEDHGKIDLEWLRNVDPPEKGKDYLLSIEGLGLKSAECVRLLTLHHPAFPVDTNVGRIAVRLGWVPLQPLPESLQLHLLEKYPVLESIQKYLWPRLCKLDQETLYELHYQMITFGKVFCTKQDPNCNACPMRGECRHFASAFASARLALPGPEEKRIVMSANQTTPEKFSDEPIKPMPLLQPLDECERERATGLCRNDEPIIEEPTTPEPPIEVLERDIEDAFYDYDDSDEIPVIKLNLQEFTSTLHNFMQEKMDMEESEVSRALVALGPELASLPAPKLKHVSRLRTEHRVYELPDSHPLLEGMDRREPDDPSPYLLAIWTPGETADSIQPPESKCSSLEGRPCNGTTCFSCNSAREADTQTVRGTILIPCRTAMRGSFPLNGTYFQVNELFADHQSSLNPIDVPRSWLWPLERRTVYFGTSVSTILKGLSTEAIQFAFWRGFVCVRGFDRESRTPRPLRARLHFHISKLVKQNEQRKSKAAEKI